MKKHPLNQKGFTTLEMLLVLIILAVVGFVGYNVWHGNREATKTLDAAQAESASTVKTTSTVKTFADCQKSPGSITQTSYPEVCVTKSEQRFTQPTSASTQQYLVIKEWGVKIPLSSSISDAYYVYTTNKPYSTYSEQAGISLNSLKNTGCSASDLPPVVLYRVAYGQKISTPGGDFTAGVDTSAADGIYKVGSYYYFAFRGTTGTCSNVQEQETAAETAQQPIFDAIKGIQAD